MLLRRTTRGVRTLESCWTSTVSAHIHSSRRDNVPCTLLTPTLKPTLTPPTLTRLLHSSVHDDGHGSGWPLIESSELNVNESDPNYVESADSLQRLTEAVEKAERGGGEKETKRHLSRNKMLPRDRIKALLDEGSDFLELSHLAGYEMYGREEVPAGSIITGIGHVHGRKCMIVANDATVKGGTYYPITARKHIRATEIAKENRLACIYVVDSGGGNLTLQSEAFADRDHFGRIFYNQAVMSAAGIPQISLVCGYCTAGGAYIPAMSDENIVVQGTGAIFLGGPPLVKAAIGEVISAEELGGADLHCRVSGVADYKATSDADAIRIARQVVKALGRDDSECDTTTRDYDSPLYPATDLRALMPTSVHSTVDVRQVLSRVVDGSRMHEFKPLYGHGLVTGFAQVGGNTIGVIGNDTRHPLCEAAMSKGSHFIQLCTQRRLPLVFFHSASPLAMPEINTATAVTAAAHKADLPRGALPSQGPSAASRYAARMMNAVACADVPKLTFVLNRSMFMANYAMCGRSFSPRFLFAWMTNPSYQQEAAAYAQRLQCPDEGHDDATDTTASAQCSKEVDPFYGSARLWDDGVIDPAATRDVLKSCLSVIGVSPSQIGAWKRNPNAHTPSYGVFRM
eukprot:GFYU01024656.1.p1 GENE.GFYU01024656.1~~GFYU01024656.1.p1  ORF type:complete len:627 (-),score=127.15 GFYU01024656.1:38-1918(-)